MCSNKLRGFKLKTNQELKHDEFYKIIQACPHVVFMPSTVNLSCTKEDIGSTVRSLMQGELLITGSLDLNTIKRIVFI